MKTMWKFFARGGHNNVYINPKRTLIFKIPRSDWETSAPERLFKIWSIVNSDIDPSAYIHTQSQYDFSDSDPDGPDERRGVVVPFIKGSQASDKEISELLVEIYQKSGRIVMDALQPGNFRKMENGKICCLDFDLALQLETSENAAIFYSDPVLQLETGKIDLISRERRRSRVSLELWRNIGHIFALNLVKNYPTHPIVVDTLRALLFIKFTRPDILDVNFLYKENSSELDYQKIRLLSCAYSSANAEVNKNASNVIKDIARQNNNVEGTGPRVVPTFLGDVSGLSDGIEEKIFQEYASDNIPVLEKEAKKFLKQHRAITLKNIKESCIKEINRYINARGSIEEGKFSYGLVTLLFRNKNAVLYKAELALEIIKCLESADSYEDMNMILMKVRQDPIFSIKESDLASRIAVCELMIRNVSDIAMVPEENHIVTKKLPRSR